MTGFATERLIAERLEPHHLEDLIRLHLDPEVSRYLGGVRSPEATRDYLKANLGHWETHGFGLWILKTADGAFIGRAGIRPLVLEGVEEIEVAYALVRGAWRRGFATEIASALVDIGITRHQLPSLVGIVSVENVASRRVLERCGFNAERPSRRHNDPVVVYRRTRD